MGITEAVAKRLSGILNERGEIDKNIKELSEVKGQRVCNIFSTKFSPNLNITTIYRICVALDMTMSEFLNDPIFTYIDIT
jgi:hypothetical protein